MRYISKFMATKFITLKNVVTVLTVSLVTLCLFELGLRQTTWRDLAHAQYHTFPPSYFKSDPIMGFDLRPNVPPGHFQFRGPGHEVFTNHLGCFDEQREIEEEYILVLGDSFTWGYSPLEHMWTSVLEQQVGRQVVKCGVDGTGTQFQFHKAERVIQKVGRSPSMILVLYTSNDFNDDLFFPGYQMVGSERVNNFEGLDLKTGEIKRNTPQELQEKMARHRAHEQRWSSKIKALRYDSVLLSVVGHVLQQAFKQAPNAPAQIMKWRYGHNFLRTSLREKWIDTAWAQHLQNIKSIAELSVQHGATFVFLDASGPPVGYGKALKAWLKNQKIPVIPMSEVAQRAEHQVFTHPFDGHWNELGNALAGQVVFDQLKRQDLLK